MHIPVFQILIPFFTALLVGLAGVITPGLVWPFAVAGGCLAFISGVMTLQLVLQEGAWHYVLGGWTAPYGIEFVADTYTAAVLLVIALVTLLVLIHSRASVLESFADKEAAFYALFMLSITGLSGLVITGDAFNMYVFLEISSLTSYALIALGGRRALFASFQYLVLGSVGACFYMLGVGYLYLKTGTLNMADMAVRIQPLLGESPTVTVGLLLILLGLAMKMALFPLHTWLPNAYTYAPHAVRCMLAPLTTKVSVFIMIRIFVSIFSVNYLWGLPWGKVVVFIACVAIVAGSLFALAQRNFTRMLTYLVVAEVGYMVGGIWVGNATGLVGAAYHVLADALMTVCLFLAAGNFAKAAGIQDISDFKGAFAKMPFTMGAFIIVALSMIGVPPTCGFFSKWYLILGGLEAGRLVFVGALLFSSLINVVLFFRIFEHAFFNEDSHGHADHGAQPSKTEIAEASLPMVGTLYVAAISLLILGWYSKFVIERIVAAGLGV